MPLLSYFDAEEVTARSKRSPAQGCHEVSAVMVCDQLQDSSETAYDNTSDPVMQLTYPTQIDRDCAKVVALEDLEKINKEIVKVPNRKATPSWSCPIALWRMVFRAQQTFLNRPLRLGSKPGFTRPIQTKNWLCRSFMLMYQT